MWEAHVSRKPSTAKSAITVQSSQIGGNCLCVSIRKSKFVYHLHSQTQGAAGHENI